MLANRINKISTNKLQWILVLLGLLIAAQIQYIQHGWLNPDTIIYFESARLIALGEWEHAFKIFNWPLYSSILVAVNKVSGLNFHHSAQMLNIIFFGITTISFLKIIAISGGDNKEILAGALILFSSHYLVGDVLEMLMRDQGFWAFFLTSVFFFIKYYKNHQLQDAILWQTCALIATLFRIEGITYLLALPLLFFIGDKTTIRSNIQHYIRCNLVNIILIITMLFAIVDLNLISQIQLGRLNEVFTLNLYSELTRKLFAQSDLMGTVVLGHYLDEFALPGLLLTFTYIIIAKTISTTGLIHTILAGFAIQGGTSLDKDTNQIFRFIASIAILNMALIITKVFVLSGRYVLALSLILMLYASFYLAVLFRHLSNNSKQKTKYQWLVIFVLIFMALNIVKNILPKRDGYNYLQNAVTWIETINKFEKPVFYDDIRMRHYANKPYTPSEKDNWNKVKASIQNGDLNQYQYLAISFSRKDADREEYLMRQMPDYQELKRFSNPDAKKYIVIYGKKK